MLHVRMHEVLFDEAVAMAATFFEGESACCGACVERSAQRMLRERFPDLHLTDMYLLIAAARRLDAQRRKRPARAGGVTLGRSQ